MKEKLLMSSWLGGNMADIATTLVGLQLPHLTEYSPVGVQFLHNGEFNQYLIAKLGLSAVYLGVYALAMHNAEKHPRTAYVMEKTLNASNYLVWLAVLANTYQILK